MSFSRDFFLRMMYVEWYGVHLLCFLLLRYVLTMVMCMCFMFVLNCALFMVLVSVVLLLYALFNNPRR